MTTGGAAVRMAPGSGSLPPLPLSWTEQSPPLPGAVSSSDPSHQPPFRYGRSLQVPSEMPGQVLQYPEAPCFLLSSQPALHCLVQLPPHLRGEQYRACGQAAQMHFLVLDPYSGLRNLVAAVEHRSDPYMQGLAVTVAVCRLDSIDLRTPVVIQMAVFVHLPMIPLDRCPARAIVCVCPTPRAARATPPPTG
jgi:hypothetical protein